MNKKRFRRAVVRASMAVVVGSAVALSAMSLMVMTTFSRWTKDYDKRARTPTEVKHEEPVTLKNGKTLYTSNYFVQTDDEYAEKYAKSLGKMEKHCHFFDFEAFLRERFGAKDVRFSTMEVFAIDKNIISYSCGFKYGRYYVLLRTCVQDDNGEATSWIVATEAKTGTGYYTKMINSKAVPKNLVENMGACDRSATFKLERKTFRTFLKLARSQNLDDESIAQPYDGLDIEYEIYGGSGKASASDAQRR